MQNYTIFTDSGSDLSPEIMNDWNVKYCCLSFTFDGDETIYSNFDLKNKEFYDNMRSGKVAKTSGVNTKDFKDAFKVELEKGNDILYLGFSSGLSVTYNCGFNAADELRDKYPDRKIITIDTLCASAGLGLIVYMAKEKRDSGASIDEVAAYVNEYAPKIAHWYTVDDLVYLKRGGRISSTAAVIGGVLNIKPVMHMNDEGRLVSKSKARGRNASIKTLAQKYTELAVDPKNNPVFISQGDCRADAEKLAELIKSAHGTEVTLITDIGPVIGAHAGPGTIALFFIGKER